MPKYNLTWQATDAKFVEALFLATGGEGAAPLQEVLLMADALDATVYTLKEVEEALEKLTAAKLVQIQKNKLALTSAFLGDDESIEESNYESILVKLQSFAPSEQSIDEARITLKKYKLKNYYQQYQEQFG